jgi:imidazolonepropionase-like amidohydrolase
MMNYNTRRTLEKALEYHLAWKAFEDGEADEKPAYDPLYDDFRGLFEREFIASVHTQIYQVLMTTLDMLAVKFQLRTVLDHSTFDAWKLARVVKEIGEDNVWTICGPRAFFLDNTCRSMRGISASWYGNGLRKVGTNTDAPVIPEEQLPFQAAMGCYFGLPHYAALKSVTSIPAEALMLEDRVGSIEVGKDADFGIWTGDPLDPRSACRITVINGKIEHDGREGSRW